MSWFYSLLHLVIFKIEFYTPIVESSGFLKVWSANPWESPGYFQGICEVKIIIPRLYLHFSLCCKCIHGAKANVGKTADFLTQIKTLTTNCTNSHYSLYVHMVAPKKGNFTYSVLEYAIKMVNFVKFQPLNTYLFNSMETT